ncbi:MAG: type II secretion system secretin GspD [Proteobacteria bacterium]|nr:type II secretion system secretin GspD [Pseudomonadota bacterium]
MTPSRPRIFAQRTLIVSLALVFSACATKRPYEPDDAMLRKSALPAEQNDVTGAKAAQSDSQRVYRGTGVLVKGQLPGGGLPPAQAITPVGGGNVVLNFEGADLREVVRNVMGDILNVNYTIDPNVGGQGTVTLRTSSGIPRDALIPTLETLLRQNGATMVVEGGLYKIIPMSAAIRGNLAPQLGNSQRALPPGYSVQIIPLRYTSAPEMAKILEPFAKDAQAVRVDTTRNLMIIAGTQRELQHLMDTIDTFDINWMAGMSVGVFTLQNADVKSVMTELDKAIGTDKAAGPLASIFKVIPIERLNAIIVVSPNAEYVEQAKQWIDRLDKGGGTDGPRFFVYHLQNTRAERLGPLLQQAFTGRSSTATTTTTASVAPGTPANTIVSPPSFSAQPAILTPPAPQVNINNQPPAFGGPNNPNNANNPNAPGTGIVRNLQVVADKDNNDILIVATPVEYQIIEAALRKLDVPARQVVMELAIIEVTLSDDFQFGVDFLFRGAAPQGRGFGGNVNTTAPVSTTVNGTTANNGLANSLIQGFTYLISNAAFPGGIQAAIKLLDTYGNAKVVSNPHLAALDNQKATIKVGTQIPINQQSIVGSTTNVVTTTSSYIDTGVLVQVTPHINAGGLVTLEVEAQVSDPGTAAAAGDAPPINSRSVQTILAVPSGETMVMGGLIQEHNSNTTSGLPLVNRIPILGGLFGNQQLKKDRTELMLFITPRVVDGVQDIDTVINDLRRRMNSIDELFPGGKDAHRIYPVGDTTLRVPPPAAPAKVNAAPDVMPPVKPVAADTAATPAAVAPAAVEPAGAGGRRARSSGCSDAGPRACGSGGSAAQRRAGAPGIEARARDAGGAAREAQGAARGEGGGRGGPAGHCQYPGARPHWGCQGAGPVIAGHGGPLDDTVRHVEYSLWRRCNSARTGRRRGMRV